MNDPDARFAYEIFHGVRHRHNPIAVTWPLGRWQAIQESGAPHRDPIEIRVVDGEDPEVVIRGILGDEL